MNLLEFCETIIDIHNNLESMSDYAMELRRGVSEKRTKKERDDLHRTALALQSVVQSLSRKLHERWCEDE